MKLNRPDVNSQSYWDNLYRAGTGERAGWFHHSKPEGAIKTFFDKEIKNKIKIGETRFIEIGGGTGMGAEIVRVDYPRLICCNLDISFKATERGKKKYPFIQQICFDLNNNTEALGLNNRFDILVCQETLEHLREPIQSMGYIMGFLRIGGVAFFSFPYNEQYNGGAEHINSFDYNDIPRLFYKFTSELTVTNYQPFNGANLHFAAKFRRTK